MKRVTSCKMTKLHATKNFNLNVGMNGTKLTFNSSGLKLNQKFFDVKALTHNKITFWKQWSSRSIIILNVAMYSIP